MPYLGFRGCNIQYLGWYIFINGNRFYNTKYREEKFKYKFLYFISFLPYFLFCSCVFLGNYYPSLSEATKSYCVCNILLAIKNDPITDQKPLITFHQPLLINRRWTGSTFNAQSDSWTVFNGVPIECCTCIWREHEPRWRHNAIDQSQWYSDWSQRFYLIYFGVYCAHNNNYHANQFS
jgi:hypothetical protein